MAIIGFIVLMLLGLLLLLVAVQMWVGSLWYGGNGSEAIFPTILAGAVIWAAFNWAPFTITLVGG